MRISQEGACADAARAASVIQPDISQEPGSREPEIVLTQDFSSKVVPFTAARIFRTAGKTASIISADKIIVNSCATALINLPVPSLWSILIGARQMRRKRKFSRADDKHLRTITASHFPDGYTILEAQGGWFDPDTQQFRREHSRQILVASSSRLKVRAWGRALGAALNQKETLLTEVGAVRIIRIARK